MNKTQKIKKFKHSKIILIFITMILLTLFIGHLSIKSEAQGKIIKYSILIMKIKGPMQAC